MQGRLQRRWDARMAARPTALHDMTPEQARVNARLSGILLLRTWACLALVLVLFLIVAQYAGLPAPGLGPCHRGTGGVAGA